MEAVGALSFVVSLPDAFKYFEVPEGVKVEGIIIDAADMSLIFNLKINKFECIKSLLFIEYKLMFLEYQFSV